VYVSPWVGMAALRVGWRILIVEDDGPLRAALADALSSDGHVVDQAEHGGRALELLAAGCRPGIILLDIVMPVMNGIRFLEAKAADPAIAAIPVVLMSATESRLMPGAVCLVRKPFDRYDIERCIELHHAPTESSGSLPSDASASHQPRPKSRKGIPGGRTR
jgi:two-component system, chemotaxis family, chemotaxis protein CheY